MGLKEANGITFSQSVMDSIAIHTQSLDEIGSIPMEAEMQSEADAGSDTDSSATLTEAWGLGEDDITELRRNPQQYAEKAQIKRFESQWDMVRPLAFPPPNLFHYG